MTHTSQNPFAHKLHSVRPLVRVVNPIELWQPNSVAPGSGRAFSGGQARRDVFLLPAESSTFRPCAGRNARLEQSGASLPGHCNCVFSKYGPGKSDASQFPGDSETPGESNQLSLLLRITQMANEGYHEPINELSDKTRDMHRAITSLMEELEAVDWYNQRVDACKDEELKAILEHNRDEEKEHAAMVLEWIRRQDPTFDGELKDYLFTEKPIAHK